MQAVLADNKMMVENGVISDAAMDQLRALPDTSERATAAFKDLEAAREAYDPNNAQSVKNYEAAESNYALQTSIDAVAEARGLDAEMLAQQIACH